VSDGGTSPGGAGGAGGRAAARGRQAVWADALLAAAVFAVDPTGLGGVAVRAQAGTARERWLAALAAALPGPVRRVPLHINDERLLGGLDLAATLRAGRPVAQRGLLAESDGGVVLLAMAERLSAGTSARLAAVLDAGEVALARDGIELRSPCRIGVVALDEGLSDDEHAPDALADRLAFHIDLSDLSLRDAEEQDTAAPSASQCVIDARARLAAVQVSDATVEALCATAAALGIASLRAPLLAVRAARALAALAGRDAVTTDDACASARLVLAPRATALPAPPAQDEDEPAEPHSEEQESRAETPPETGEPRDDEPAADAPDKPLDDVVLEAAQAAIPAGLLAQLTLAQGSAPRARSAGRAGAVQQGKLRGRPAAARRGEPRGGERLNLIETLRAAAPWQRLRRAETQRATGDGPPRIEVRAEDFHVNRLQQRTQTTTIFVIDASGSSALNRLAEAKGAVELLLADCYVRRDRVAVLAFRGRGAELLLPPTRSLVRAKRSLASLPGGGGTPLAAGIDAALALADAVQRRGETPLLVLLTDGRANIGRDGNPGRARADDDALTAARQMRLGRFAALLVDTSPQPQPSARRLAAEMGATYLPLPYAGAAQLSQAVRAVGADPVTR